MPNFDGTGPQGRGPRTGRGGGRCVQGNTVSLSKEEQVKVLNSEKAKIEAKLKDLQ
ncbi:DUF5320 family protein [Patescibacteria group bacterium]|nr:DUF5320 family protein [Patescibacteria group bacterium]